MLLVDRSARSPVLQDGEVHRHVPEAAWIEARRLAAPGALTLTPDVVAHLALACDASHDASRQAS